MLCQIDEDKKLQEQVGFKKRNFRRAGNLNLFDQFKEGNDSENEEEFL